MSFGRPPSFSDFKVSPPERGSFPLDHEGECKSVMQEYMNCIKKNKNDNGACRHLSKAYLQCRMDKGLMDKDEMDNLGFKGVSDGQTQAQKKSSEDQTKSHADKTGDAKRTGSSDAYPTPMTGKSTSNHKGSKEYNESQKSHSDKVSEAAKTGSSNAYPTPTKGQASPSYAGSSHGDGGQGVSNSPGYAASSSGVGGASGNGGVGVSAKGSRQV